MIVQGCAEGSSSQADGVGPTCRVVDGRAGGLRHGPLVPNLLSVVATPETDGDVIALGHRNGLLLGGREFRSAAHGEPKVNDVEEQFLL